MKQAVCVILRQGDKLLGVSRKDNHSDFGLVGGKVDPEDLTVEAAAVRETKEETGLDITNLKLVDSREWGGYMQHCFEASHSGEISFDQTKETHVVEWLDPAVIMQGSFGEYNDMVFKKLGII